MTASVIGKWHDYIRHGSRREELMAMLAEDAVFQSPIVHTPQKGREITALYLASAAVVLNDESFRYLEEWIGPHSAVLEFEAVVDGITINGVDMIWWNENDQITRFKVMVRPLKAINLLHQKMAAQLQAAKPG
jgi:hypothetical protein